MQKIIGILLAMLPGFLSTPLHRLRGYNIGKGARIRWGTLLLCRQFTAMEGASIGPLVLIISRDGYIGAHTQVKAFTYIRVPRFHIGHFVKISGPTAIIADQMPQAQFSIGDHSLILPFCWIEPGMGITIGPDTAIGGHTQIFTHGAWTHYFERGPYALGPVSIADNVYVGWRTFILPNVHIGRSVVIGANSVVTRDIPDNAIAVGKAASVVKQVSDEPLTQEEVAGRMQDIMDGFEAYASFNECIVSRISRFAVRVNDWVLSADQDDLKAAGDCLLYFDKHHERQMEQLRLRKQAGLSYIDLIGRRAQVKPLGKEAELFFAYLRKFGIRPYINYEPDPAS